jgi:methylenetetrahydrofolate dehydrogenase (NADP+)/methenyltetrahydrofolate cyclohydrolase
MIVDGKQIARELQVTLREEARDSKKPLSLGVLVVGENLATKKFVDLKHAFGSDIGVSLERISYGVGEATTDMLTAAVFELAQKHQGIIVQFPLPSGVDADQVRNAIPAHLDVDVVSDEAFVRFENGASPILPPVVGAIQTILNEHRVSLAGKRVVVVGNGRLVGRPAAIWARNSGADVVVVTEETSNVKTAVKSADVLILGAGSPGVVTPEMVRNGVVVFDAGTSEAKGRLQGDAEPTVAEKASLFTPVPGGIGPITVAMIFKNLITLARSQEGI